MKAVAIKTLCNEDWKTQLARGYRNIPRGAIVEVTNLKYVNFYGTWCEVEWEGNHYYVSRRDLDFHEEAIKKAEQNKDKE